MSTPPHVKSQVVNASPQYESITGVVERLTFHSEESGYTIARLQRERASELTTIVGSFANIQAGQTLQLTGFWRDHPQYGTQFQVTQYKETKPATLTGLEKYLGSGLIKGVGPVTAKRIQLTDELEAAYEQIAINTERISSLERRLNQLERRLEELTRDEN
jgi:exodeoxyribonuclease V alpha subunit